ncbi:MAG: hypothetical protein GX918_08500 [Clostridiales bacterium]|jgi:transketolase|nr:hypothetical protein [Clostridiales bacterium]
MGGFVGFDSGSIRRFSADIRIATINALCEAGFGHIGGSMSMADALAVFHSSVMRVDPQNPDWRERDCFFLSKGHAGPRLYTALTISGFSPRSIR